MLRLGRHARDQPAERHGARSPDRAYRPSRGFSRATRHRARTHAGWPRPAPMALSGSSPDLGLVTAVR